MTAGTKTCWQTLPVGCGPLGQRQGEAAPCCCLLSSLSPRQRKTTMTDKTLKSVGCVSHFATALLSWGLGPFGFNLCCHSGCWTPFHVAATNTTSLPAQHCSTQLCSALLGSLQLSWTGVLPCLSVPCGILLLHHCPSPPCQFRVSLLFSTTSWSHSSDKWVRERW